MGLLQRRLFSGRPDTRGNDVERALGSVYRPRKSAVGAAVVSAEYRPALGVLSVRIRYENNSRRTQPLQRGQWNLQTVSSPFLVSLDVAQRSGMPEGDVSLSLLPSAAAEEELQFKVDGRTGDFYVVYTPESEMIYEEPTRGRGVWKLRVHRD